jgi:hypothetical protein
VVLDTAGDFSTYTFTLVANPATGDPPGGFDPQLSSVDFSFKAGCDSAGDCAPDTCCPPKLAAEPDINYLAKEFDGFNQVMLDRLAVLVPNWRETHPSDMDVAFVEALAYLADHLSYQQDAIGTEAYIGTARSRISMRRLAKLVDYKLDEGANARTWVHVDATQNGVVIPAGTALYPRVPGLPPPFSRASRRSSSSAPRWRSRPCKWPYSFRSRTKSIFTLGATPTAACPLEAHRRRLRTTLPDFRPEWFSFSKKKSVRTQAIQTMPIL